MRDFTITMKEVLKSKCNTYGRKDNSIRGIETVSKYSLKVGDKIVINNYFHTIV